MSKYGILYAQSVFPKGHKYHWLRFCNLTNILPIDIKQSVKTLSDNINEKYTDNLIVKMDNSIFPGCVITPDKIEEIVKDIYDGMNSIFNETNCIRLVYGIGEIDEDWMKTVESAHHIGSFPIMVKIGRTLESDDTPGIFNVYL